MYILLGLLYQKKTFSNFQKHKEDEKFAGREGDKKGREGGRKRKEE